MASQPLTAVQRFRTCGVARPRPAAEVVVGATATHSALWNSLAGNARREIVVVMPLPKLGNDDLLVWRFGIAADEPDVVDMPGADIEPPTVWVDAIITVATDLRVLRYGRVVDPDRLVWELAVTGQDTVMIGWGTTAHVGGFRVGEGMQVETSFAAAAVWVADIAQTELGGYEFVQWPSRGEHALRPRETDRVPVWLDPRTERLIAPIGELRSDTRW